MSRYRGPLVRLEERTTQSLFPVSRSVVAKRTLLYTSRNKRFTWRRRCADAAGNQRRASHPALSPSPSPSCGSEGLGRKKISGFRLSPVFRGLAPGGGDPAPRDPVPPPAAPRARTPSKACRLAFGVESTTGPPRRASLRERQVGTARGRSLGGCGALAFPPLWLR